MATPYEHAHVAHLTKTKRRRSRSLTLPNVDEEEVRVQQLPKNKLLAQLRKERQKAAKSHGEDDFEPSVIRIARTETSRSTKKNYSSAVFRVADSNDEDDFEPTVTRVARTDTSKSTKKDVSSIMFRITDSNDEDDFEPTVTRVAHTDASKANKKNTVPTVVVTATDSNNDDDFEPAVTRAARTTTTTTTTTAAAHKVTHVQERIQENNPYSHVIQLTESGSIKSTGKPLSLIGGQQSTPGRSKKNLNGHVTPSDAHIDLESNSSHTFSNPFATSSTNILSQSEIFDQEFHLNDDKAHARRNMTPKVTARSKLASEKSTSVAEVNRGPFFFVVLYARFYTANGKTGSTHSSASFMSGVIAIIIGAIAFALALTAFILVLLLRSTVEASLASNSTASKSNGALPAACSAYTAVNDPTRSVYAAGYALGCDNTPPFQNRTNPVWIRFVGTGGTTLPLSDPGMNICGSTGAGWYSGAMPTYTGEIVNGTACFTWDTSVCRFSSTIRVAHCGSFYIYLLPPPPACMMRYCTI